MPSPPRALRRSASDLPFLVFLVTVPLCLLRAADLPTVEVGALERHRRGSAFVAVTAVLAAWRLLAERAASLPLALWPRPRRSHRS